jgi:hypothetical protein
MLDGCDCAVVVLRYVYVDSFSRAARDTVWDSLAVVLSGFLFNRHEKELISLIQIES